MSKHKFSKPVAFNLKNEKDVQILEHVKRRNFSGYVKKLILADIEVKKEKISESNPTNVSTKPSENIAEFTTDKTPPKKETSTERLKRLKRSNGKPFKPRS